MKLTKKVLWTLLLFIPLFIISFFNVDLSDTFIYPITEQVVKYHVLIDLLLMITAIVGLTYHNKKAYYSNFIDIGLFILYICISSYYIVNILSYSYTFGIIFFIACLLLFLGLFIIKDIYTETTVQTTRPQNIHDPICQIEDLYECRIFQTEEVINILNSKISDSGYSICISGKWGSGKTSFINAMLDKMNKESSNIKKRIYEIRINAMELDTLNSLVNYLFNRIKDILKENNIYVGINSEYQNLISSLAGTIINETASNFINNKLSENSDYRENLYLLSKILSENITNSKIIIIVDDVDRCSKEKALDFIFFIKEISSLNRVVIITLIDYDKLIESCDLGESEEFIDKFFNYRINLSKSIFNEIINKSINNTPFKTYLSELELKMKNEIEEAEKSDYNSIDIIDRQKNKEERINKAKENYFKFFDIFENPRNIIKAYDKYTVFIKEVNKLDNSEEFKKYLRKVEYEKQIAIIAILYSFFPSQYIILESSTIENFVSSIDRQDSKDIIKTILDEWYKFEIIPSYNLNEKRMFIKYLINAPTELPKIANSFSTLQEEYISKIQNNTVIQGVPLDNVICELASANYSSQDKIENYINRAFEVYKSSITFEDIQLIFHSDIFSHGYFQNRTYFIILTNIVKIINEIQDNSAEYADRIISSFKNFIWCIINNISRYILLLDSNETINWDDYQEKILNANDFKSSLIKYCSDINSNLHLNMQESNNPLILLKRMITLTDELCVRYGIDTKKDVIKSKEIADITYNCIECLFKISTFFESRAENNLKANNNELEPSILAFINLIKDDNYVITYKERKILNKIFREMNVSNCSIETYSNLLEIWYISTGESCPTWRAKLLNVQKELQPANNMQY